MKLEIDGSPTVSTGVEDEFEFGIAENEVAFDAWSNKLYTRKERAIVRELSCNAWDAHVAAGVPDKPFEIHLPTQHEPYFSINDFGTGLSHEDMKMLFSLYFGSNKRNSNKFIGALGLGSKSPFAYKGNGGTYSVISRKDGVTRMYVASKRNGKPHMEQLGQPIETPDAPNGVEIKFAVDTKDIWTWENEAKVALEFISPMPTLNIANFEPKRYQYSLKTDKWGVRTESSTAFGYQVRCIMGNVQYSLGEVDRSLIKSDVQSKILGMPIDMFFPLGALDFSLSREALEMTDKTVAAVLGMCETIYDEFMDTVKSKIDACETLWDAQIMLFSLINVNSSSIAGGATMGGLITKALDSGKLWGQYKNFVFDERSTKLITYMYNHVGVSKFDHNSRAAKRAKKSVLFNSDARTARSRRILAKTDTMLQKSSEVSITVEPKVRFVINDTKLPGDKFIHYFLQESGHANGCKVVYVIHRNEKDVELTTVVKEGKKLLADLGGPTAELMSTLTVKYPFLNVARTSGGGTGSGLGRGREIVAFKSDLRSRRRYSQKGWTKAWRNITEEEVSIPKKFYVALDKLVATNTNFSDAWEFETFIQQVRATAKFGLGDAPVFGIKSNSKLLKNNKGEYVELMTHVFSRVKAIMTPTKTLSLSLYVKPFRDDMKDLLEYIAEKQPLTSSPFQQFALALAEADAITESNWSNFQWVLNFCEGRGKYTPGQVMDFNKQFVAVKALYPMLSVVDSYASRTKRDVVLDYIKLVDESNQREALAKAAASNS